jgi:hypothetical protein
MDFNKASNETLHAMALDANFAAMRLELRAVGLAVKFGEPKEVRALQIAAEYLAQAANSFTRQVLLREGVTTEEEMAALAEGITQQPAAPAQEPTPKKTTFFGAPW